MINRLFLNEISNFNIEIHKILKEFLIILHLDR
jgi:hypothetical protein